MREFATDEQIAARVRAVALELRRRDFAAGAGVLGALALELEGVARILDRDDGTAASVQEHLPID